MTHKADTLRPFLRCAAVVLCSLALPLAVFALWDRALLAAPHTRTDDERFSAGGRANATACTLYAAEHVTKVSLSSNSVWDGGWTAGTMDGSALARARRTLRALHEAGLLCDDSFAAALSVCRLDYGSWELYTAPCGLTQLNAMHYGTLPIVRETGGLKDTVEPYNDFTGDGNGFTFDRYEAGLLLDAVNRAKTVYFTNRYHWDEVVQRDMAKDVSWQNSARQYKDLYLELTQW